MKDISHYIAKKWGKEAPSMTHSSESKPDNGYIASEEPNGTLRGMRGLRLLASSVAIAVIVVALYLAQLYSYLLFHSIIELVSIVIAFGVFIIGWNTTKFSKNELYLYLGVAYLSIGSIDLIHTLGFQGMGVFPGAETNLCVELWIAARYLESISLLGAPLIVGKRIRRSQLLIGFFVVTSLLLSSILVWDVFPDCWIDGSGLTPFKILSEYAISGILLVAVILFQRKREALDPYVLRLLTMSLFATITAEMAFTLYVDVYGFANMIGHYLKLVSFFLVYRAIIHASLTRPYEVLFRDLKQNEQRLAERTIQLEATNEEMEAFSYSVSHDLKSPLRTIDGFSRLLLSDHLEGLNDEARHYLERIRAGTQRMDKVIDDLLRLSRLTRAEIQRQAVNLTDLCHEIVTGFQRSEPERKAKFLIEEELVLDCDPGQLRIAMTNLLGNAWKFTLHSPEARIEVGRTELDGHTVFFVRDNGTGFDMDYADKMFAPFQRFHTETEFEGSGIGLATVKRIVNRHGGAIWGEGEVGEGATFFFRFDGSAINHDRE